MSNHLVSIVVTVYNAEKYIDNCVKNLLAQKYGNLEFILVDDGSKDRSAEICDLYAAKDSRFKVVHQENQGPSAARNAGTEVASGEYLIYVDVDDDFLDTLVEDNVRLAVEKDADVVFYNFWYHNLDDGKRVENSYAGEFCGDAESFFASSVVKAIEYEIINAPWNKVFKTSFLRSNGLEFTEEFSIYEDLIFSTEMIQFAKRIVVNPKRYYVYYLRSSGSQLTKYADNYFEAVSRFYDNAMKYCSSYQDNEDQKSAFSKRYVSLVVTNIKQISCKKEFNNSQKLERISKICRDLRFIEALNNQNLDPRKKIIRTLASLEWYHAIILMYRLLGKTG